MASKKAAKPAKAAAPKVSAAKAPAKAGKQTERVAIFLPADQSEWLKKKGKISETVRALITEAMNMERLAESLKKGKKK
jgi:ribosomal protein S16